jgi:uncharacterized membrane protein
MKTKTIICAILSIIFISAGAGQGYQQIIDLETLAGYPASVGWSINDDGQIVGWAADNNSVDSLACVFDETGNGANINLGDGNSVALGSNSNRIVGQLSYYDYNYPPISYSVACIFNSAGSGVNISLGTLGGSASGAQAINSSGQIVGWAQDSLPRYRGQVNSNYWLACIFDNTGGGANKRLGTLGGHISQGLANNSSKIIGYADNNSNYERACIFDPTGDSNNNIDLGTLGGESSLAWSINSNNQIVGWAFNNSLRYHACLFNSAGNGNNIDLGGLAADGNSEAYCINDDGWIVGYAENSSKQPAACLFNKAGGSNNIDLNTLIDPASGWTLQYAYSINYDGLIVGQGIHNGQAHAFLLIIKAIRLTTPNGGEILTADNTYPITWKNTGPISNVLLEYSTNNGQNWNVITTAPNTGSYDWHVPAANSSQCLIRITDSADPTVSDTSNAVFTIAKTFYVDNDAPNDPEPNNPNVSDPLEGGTAAHPFDAIQEGINAAINGGIVIVLPGEYTGNGNRDINFEGKAITVRSTAPNNPGIAAATIVNCNGTNHRGFKFFSSEGHDSILEGLTITNAHIQTTFEGGAGIYIDGASPTINKCIVTNNRAELVSGSEDLCLGGGIYVGADSNPLITNCIIRGNSVGDWGWGGGIYCDYFATGATLRNCIISKNTALGNGGQGGGIYCDGSSDLTVVNCNIVNNSAAENGGGINFYIYLYLYMHNPPIRTITNSIIWGNSPDQIYPVDAKKIVGTYSDIQGGWSGTGNINAEPRFVDANNNDYHLKSAGWRWDKISNQWTWDDVTSRCIDAGNPGYPLCDEPMTLPVDPRNRFGVNKRIDMGYYGGTVEASMPPYNWALLADMDNSGKVDFVDYSLLAELYGNSADKLNGDLNRDGKVDMEDLKLLAADWLGYTD